MSKLWDSHMHTAFSGDSEAPVSEMIETSRDLGLCGITITDHLDWDYKEAPGQFDLDVPDYLSKIKETSAKYSTDSFKVAAGIEIGLQEHLADRIRALVSENSFDYVIGSIHVVNGRDPYYDPYFKGRTPRECYIEYLDTMLSNLQKFHEMDALGHLDYVVRYAIKRFGMADSLMSYAAYGDYLEAILRFIMDHDIALEVNTGGYRHKLPEPNPSYEIIQAYYEMGGRLITLGADAHKPDDIAIGFDKTVPVLKDIGFTSYAVYINRQIKEMPL